MNNRGLVTPGIHLLFNPLVPIVLGGILAVVSVRYFSTLLPSFLGILVATSLVCLLLGILWLHLLGPTEWFALVLIGFGAFLLYAGFSQYRTAVKRRWIMNRRLHFTGRVTSPNNFLFESINGEPLDGRLFVLGDLGESGTLTRGETRRVSLTGRIEWHSVSNSFRSYLVNEHYLGVLRPLEVHSNSRAVTSGSVSPVFGWVQSLRSWLGEISYRAPYSALFIQALTTGDRTFPNQLNLILRRLGIIHLFVISGLHVGLLLMVLGTWFSPLPILYRGLAIGICLLAYLSFLGWPVSAVRAGAMLGLGGLSYYLTRRTTPADILCTVFFLMMVWSPFIVFDVGFQLSMSALVGILLILPDFRGGNEPVGVQFLRVNVGAYFGTLPVILWHFQYFAPLGILGSYVAGLLFPFLVLGLGLQVILLAVKWTWLYGLFERGLAEGIGFLLSLFNDTGLVWGVPEMSGSSIALISLLVIVCLTSHWSRLLRGASAIALGLVLTLLVWSGSPSYLEIRIVENQPVIFLTSSNRTNSLLLPRGSRLNTFKVDRLSRYLRKKGVRHLNYLMSDYNRRLFTQFDPDFTVGQFLPYGSNRGPVAWEGGSFDVVELHLESTFTNIELRSGDDSGSIPFRSEGLFARSRDGRCLVNDPSSLDLEEYRKLHRKNCNITVLREAPLLYEEVNGPGKRRRYRAKSLFSRVLTNGAYLFRR